MGDRRREGTGAVKLFQRSDEFGELPEEPVGASVGVDRDGVGTAVVNEALSATEHNRPLVRLRWTDQDVEATACAAD